MNEEEKLENQNLPDRHSGNKGEAPDMESKSADEAGLEENTGKNILQTKEPEITIEKAKTQQPQTRNSKPNTEPMEVHHHTHPGHHKKKWTDYFWEFLMLFLAVFCGFLAEYQLEHVIEHQRENEYVLSMVEDTRTDTANYRRALARIKQNILYADSLALICFSYNGSRDLDQKIYRFYRQLLSNTETIAPTERTITQLKNSGGMRLIRKKQAADAIVLYDYVGKQLLNAQTNAEFISLETGKLSMEMMNFKYFNPGIYRGLAPSATLMIKDTAKIIAFGNHVSFIGATLSVAAERLQKLNDQAIALIATLTNQYDLEGE